MQSFNKNSISKMVVQDFSGHIISIQSNIRAINDAFSDRDYDLVEILSLKSKDDLSKILLFVGLKSIEYARSERHWSECMCELTLLQSNLLSSLNTGKQGESIEIIRSMISNFSALISGADDEQLLSLKIPHG